MNINLRFTKYKTLLTVVINNTQSFDVANIQLDTVQGQDQLYWLIKSYIDDNLPMVSYDSVNLTNKIQEAISNMVDNSNIKTIIPEKKSEPVDDINKPDPIVGISKEKFEQIIKSIPTVPVVEKTLDEKTAIIEHPDTRIGSSESVVNVKVAEPEIVVTDKQKKPRKNVKSK